VTPSYLPGLGFSIGAIVKFKTANESGPLSQALTQANQAFVAQSQQVNANVQAVDHIFSAWSQHVDQVVQNIPGLQGLQDTIQTSAELQAKTGVGSQQHKDNPTLPLSSAELQAKTGVPTEPIDWDRMSRQAFEAFNQRFAQGGFNNGWGIVKAEPHSYKVLEPSRFQLDTRFQLDINLTRKPFMGELYHSTLSITFSVGSWRDFDMKSPSVAAVGSEVKTDGHPDPSLFLLQAALLGFSFNYQPYH
jgi:hypothetical protein